MKRRKAIIWIFTITGMVTGYQLLKSKQVLLEPNFEFLDFNRDLIASIVDIILPENEYIGAKQAEVHDYIIAIVKYSMPLSEVKIFIDGIKDIREKTLSKYDKEYEDCTEEEKSVVISSLLNEFHLNQGLLGKVKNQYFGKSFFDLVKELTVEGYCTSKEGATTALVYLPIPGLYVGCIKINNSHNSWAL